MADNQVKRGPKVDAGHKPVQKQSRVRRPVKLIRADEEPPKDELMLTGSTRYQFEIGGGAVTFVLSGTGLDFPLLKAVVLRMKAKDDYSKLPETAVLIEQPGSDDTTATEFPLSLKVLDAVPGYYYLAVEWNIKLPGHGEITKRAILPYSITFTA